MRRALAFLTPLGGSTLPAPSALKWFPAIGAFLGITLGVGWSIASDVWGPGVAAALVLCADLGLTGLLHVEGLVHCADGLLARIPPDRRLAVMAAPGVGVTGLVVATATVLARFSALSSMKPAPLLLAGLWCLSRTAMAVVALSVPYVRQEGGLVTAVLEHRTPLPILLAGLAASLGLAAAWGVPAGTVAVACAAVGAFGVASLARRRIGGFTGDVLGATCIVAETVGLVVAAAKW